MPPTVLASQNCMPAIHPNGATERSAVRPITSSAEQASRRPSGAPVSVQLHEASIRPAAILPIDAATQIVSALEKLDVSKGGVWNATPGVWQRYDRSWDGPAGSRGTAELVGSIAVVYDRPRRHEITVYKA